MHAFYNLPKFKTLIACLAFMGAICVVEVKTPDQLSFGNLYLFPVALASWAGGIRWGLLAAFLGAVCWGIGNYATAAVYDQVGYRFWTMGNDVTTFGFMAWLVDRFHSALVEQQAIAESLKRALNEVKTLEDLFPICAWCKRVRDDKGYWNQIEDYLALQKGAKISHGICPECREKAQVEFKQKPPEAVTNQP